MSAFQLALPLMRELAIARGITVTLWRRMGNDRIVLVSSESSPTDLHIYMPLGQRLPVLIPLSLIAALLAACGSPGPRPPASTETIAQASRPVSEKGNEIVLYAMGLLDTGYRFGGKNPEAGLDCSGMVSYIYGQAAGLRVQGSAADIMKIAMIRAEQTLAEAHVKSRIILQIHDELVVEIAPGEGDQVTELVRNAMEHAVDLAVPLDVSCGIGSDWQLAAH